MPITWTIAVASLAALLGMAWGRWALTKSLTLGADDPGKTPHKLGGRFYYVVPEREYVELRMLMYRVSPVDEE